MSQDHDTGAAAPAPSVGDGVAATEPGEPASTDAFTRFTDASTTALLRAGVRQALKGGGLPASDFDDLIRDTQLGLLQRLPRFDPSRGSWSGFVLCHAQRLAASWMRKWRRRRRIATITTFTDLEAGVRTPLSTDGTLAPEDLVAGRRDPENLDLRLDLDEVLVNLRPADRVLARLLVDHSYREIAQRLGGSSTAVWRAVQRLRRGLSAVGVQLWQQNRPAEVGRG